MTKQKNKTIISGRPPLNPPADPQTRANYTAAMMKSKYRSLRQWAIAADVPYTQMQRYAKGEQMPQLITALLLVKLAGTTVEKLYGHLVEGRK